LSEDLEYCRSVEAYLCRRNDGHLIRIVGPSFELVSGWSSQGIPLKVVFRGIDHSFERYYRKGPRRRPLRVEYCEADVLDVFDAWRRALGVTASAGEQDDGEVDAAGHPHRRSLPSHLERALSRLAAAEARADATLRPTVGAVIRELELMRASARGARGDARQAILERLIDADRELLQAARAGLDGATAEAIAAEADGELAPFKSRMPPDAFARALTACVDRIIRERSGLPSLSLD
jgi:hypothetical protein